MSDYMSLSQKGRVTHQVIQADCIGLRSCYRGWPNTVYYCNGFSWHSGKFGNEGSYYTSCQRLLKTSLTKDVVKKGEAEAKQRVIQANLSLIM